jgi:hypothetical protein
MRIKRTTAVVAGIIGATWMVAILGLAKGLGLTSLNIPLALAALTTGSASGMTWLLGLVLFLLIGAAAALLYAAVFESVGGAGPARGALLGLAHWILTGLLLAFIPAMDESLTGPGFMGINRGIVSPPLLLAAHLVFGAVVGGVYRASPAPVRHYAHLNPRGLRPAHG